MALPCGDEASRVGQEGGAIVFAPRTRNSRQQASWSTVCGTVTAGANPKGAGLGFMNEVNLAT